MNSARTMTIELIRVSTAEQATNDHASIPAQHVANLRTCQLHGLEICETVEMTDVSGTAVLYSPEMQRLLRLITRPEIGALVAREHSRLMRPASMADYALAQALIENHIVLYTPDGVCDLSTKHGRFLSVLRWEMGEMERRDFLEKSWGAKELMRRRGENPQGNIVLPYGVGYDKSRPEGSRWHYLPEAENVREVFRRFLSGEQSYQELRKYCGLSNPGVRSVLSNPIYCGIRQIDQRRDSRGAPSRKLDGRQGDRPKVMRTVEETIRVRVIPQSEALISEDDFSRVQQLMALKAVRHWRAKRTCQPVFSYTGFLSCALCGEPLYTSHSRPTEYYYVCKGRRSQRGCRASYMRQDLLEAKLDSLFAQRLSNISFLLQSAAELQQQGGTVASQSGARLRGYKAKLEQKRQRVLEAYMDALISKSDRDRRLLQISEEFQHLERKLEQETITNQPVCQPEITLGQLADVIFPFIGWGFLDRSSKRAILSTMTPSILVANYEIRLEFS